MADEEVPALEEAVNTERPTTPPVKADTDKKDPAPRAEGAGGRVAPEDYVLNLGQQEVERILGDIEDNCQLVIETAGRDAWLPVEGLQNITINNLGYEDADQFEDALGGTFEQFLRALPHMELKIQDDGSSVDGQLVFRLKVPPAHYSKKGIIMKLEIKESKDLWRTLMKSPQATIEIPELEFEVGASQKRQIDAVYNHFTTACFNLGQHIRDQRSSMSADVKEKISDCIDQINNLLDIPHPWTMIIHDPSGESIFKPDDGVQVELMGQLPQIAEVA
jgi:mediator of RNA polymerase II transcription subunit 31